MFVSVIFIRNICLCLFPLFGICFTNSPYVSRISPGSTASQADWAGHGGLFLVSNNSAFGFGFKTAPIDPSSFILIITHINSSTTVWTANRGKLVSNSAIFVFDTGGNAYLQDTGSVAWGTNTTGKRATSMVLQDSGNLVLTGDEDTILWQSFSRPTDTLLPGQEFTEGMRLRSFPNSNNLALYLEIISGDMVLYAGFKAPQTYWSIKNDSRRTNGTVTGHVHSALISSGSWNFFGPNKALLWRFVFSESQRDDDEFWIAFLGQDGTIGFTNLRPGGSSGSGNTRIPQYTCEAPEYCNPYYMCYFGNRCQCPPTLSSEQGCKPRISSSCRETNESFEFLYVGKEIDYFAIPYSVPSLKGNMNSCIEACRSNCSCNVLFFQESSGNCFLFDEIGSYRSPSPGSTGFVSYVKVSSGNSSKKGSRKTKRTLVIIFVVIGTAAIASIMIFSAIRCYYKGKNYCYSRDQDSEDEDFFEDLPGMATRFLYADLRQATKDFSMRIGQGGFGSVYMGVMPNGTLSAIKKLEGIGQGKKEFRVEVSTIGSIHHVHLVKLKGFCVEGPHRLLVYEYMPNGSLDRWIFKNPGNEERIYKVLDWNTRFSIALGIARGIAYLHDECEEKIVHCDIKPQNILLDDNFTAKVSDFGLAKLMGREESLVYTTLRGTRGYLAPEWIKNNPISEKSECTASGW